MYMHNDVGTDSTKSKPERKKVDKTFKLQYIAAHYSEKENSCIIKHLKRKGLKSKKVNVKT